MNVLLIFSWWRIWTQCLLVSCLEASGTDAELQLDITKNHLLVFKGYSRLLVCVQSLVSLFPAPFCHCIDSPDIFSCPYQAKLLTLRSSLERHVLCNFPLPTYVRLEEVIITNVFSSTSSVKGGTLLENDNCPCWNSVVMIVSNIVWCVSKDHNLPFGDKIKSFIFFAPWGQHR